MKSQSVKVISGILAMVILLTMLGLFGRGGGTDYSATIEQMTAFIEQKMEENDVTGLSIALVDGQRVVWAEGFGYADREKGIPATAETIYEIGSISKTITATAIMQLAEEGLLDIDHPLTDYLPEFSIQPPLSGPTPGGPITIRTMLTHHSGIPGILLNGAVTREPNPGYNEWLLNYLHGEYAAYPTNFVWDYSNCAVSLLGEVVAKVSGQSFEEYTDKLFEKMGMPHSSFFLHKPYLKQNLAQGYFGEEPVAHFYLNMWGSGSVVSNVLDMAQYIKMIHADGRSVGGPVLRPETLAEMLTQQNEGIPLDCGWRQGLIWVLGDPELDYAGRVCWKDAGTIAYRSQLEILLDHQLGVVVLSNSGTAGDVVVEVAKQALKLALKEKAGIDPVAPMPPPYSPYTTRPQEELQALAGVYVTFAGYDFVKAVPGALEWIRAREPAQKLVPLKNGWFALPDSQEFQIEFDEISGRDVMVWHGTEAHLVGEKYQPVAVPSVWRERLGKYEITNLNPEDCSWFVPANLRTVSLSIELKEKDEMLLIELPDWGIQLVIEPLTDTLGLIRGLAQDRGGAVQIVMVDGQEHIQLWGSLYKK
jgi:CubicO group peptidase (beta-lactamase class C family)